MSDAPIHVTDSVFQKQVLESTVPVIVDFWAPWCGPCRMIAPVLDKLAKEQSGKLIVAKVNVDENQPLAVKFGVMSIPTLIVFKGGQQVDRIVGNVSRDEILRHLAKVLG